MSKYILTDKRYFFFFIFMSIIYSIGTASVSLLLAFIVDAATGDSISVLIRIALCSISLISFYVFFSYIYERMKNRLLKNAMQSLKSDVFFSIMKMRIVKFEKLNSAAYINEFTTKINMMEELYFSNIFSTINLSVSFTTAVIITLYYQPLLLILMAVLGLITAIITKITGKGIEYAVKVVSDNSQYYQVALKEYFLGFRVIKAFSIATHIFDLHNNLNSTLEKSKLDYRNKSALIMKINTLTGFLSTAVIMALTAGFAIKGLVSVGTVFMVGHLMGQVTSPISLLPQIIIKFKSTAAIKQELLDIISNTEHEEIGILFTSITQKISISDLSFAYDQQNVLNALSVSFEVGKKYAIVGASGSGKTTMISLLLGYYDNYTGSIMYDNHELRNLSKEDIYRNIGVVFQDTFLFDDTIRNNLTLFNDSFSDKQIMEAIDLAGLSTFINNFPGGLNGKITENGKNISGGERQRICLARIFLRKQQVLFLDEFTTNLDSETAYGIEQHLLSMENLTLLAITHRLNKTIL